MRERDIRIELLSSSFFPAGAMAVGRASIDFHWTSELAGGKDDMIIAGVLVLICGLATPFLYRGLVRLSEGLPVSYQIAASHICLVLALVGANLAVMAIYMLYDEAMIVIVPAFLIGAAIPKWR